MGFQMLTLVKLLIILVFTFPQTFCEQDVKQKAILYNKDGSGNDNSSKLEVDDPIPDLSTEDFDNKTQSVCVTGLWLFYKNANYTSETANGIQVVYGKDKDKCVNLVSTVIGGGVTSVRYAGDGKNYTRDSFTLYEGSSFREAQEVIYDDEPNIQFKLHHSIIITGNSDWTAFDGASFTGHKTCLRIQGGTPLIISNIEAANVGLRYDKIRSIRKGC